MWKNNLKQIREQKGLTKAQMSRVLNLPYTTYNGYEIGNREPKFGTLKDMALLLNVDLFDICDPGFDEYSKELVRSTILPENNYNDTHNALLKRFDKLNSIGRVEAVTRIDELTQISKYTKPDN